jgi:hypothetical protein
MRRTGLGKPQPKIRMIDAAALRRSGAFPLSHTPVRVSY